jgi:hypothetical protein
MRSQLKLKVHATSAFTRIGRGVRYARDDVVFFLRDHSDSSFRGARGEFAMSAKAAGLNAG